MRKLSTLLLAFSLTGCATIMQGSKQDVGIASSPTGARVMIDGIAYGQTPVTAKLARKDHHTVRLELDGYAPYEMKMTRGVSGWVWGNLLFGGIPGLAIDALTGGLYKLTPDNIVGTLASAPAGGNKDLVLVNIVLGVDPSWEKVGQMERN